jgi:CelD/BcsL family acetyltransferase involved in cellulose biosynthesis
LPLAFHKTLLNREGVTGRVLTYCGSRELYPDHLDVITAQENAEQCIDALCRFLTLEYRDWDVCNLKLFAEESNLVKWLNGNQKKDTLRFDSMTQKSSFAHYIPIHGSFQEYINTFDTKQKYNFRSRNKKLEQQGFMYNPCDPMMETKGFDMLFEIHALRAKKKRIESTFKDAAIIEFHKSLSKRINHSGWLSLRFLSNEKDIIAASYNFNYEGRVFSYQKGMDPKWERYGPGKAIVYEAIKEAFLNGYKEYNFLHGNEEYKADWTQTKRLLLDIIIYNRTFNAFISKTLLHVKMTLKKIEKGLVGRA